MSSYRSWAAKQSGKPVLLLIAAVGFTFSFWGMYKYAYKPWARRNRLNEAEAYANFLLTKENEKQIKQQ